MSEQIVGTFEGDGPNVVSSAGVAGPAIVPDVQSASTNANSQGQGRSSAITIDARRRLRVSNEAARAGTAIAVSSVDQVLTKPTRWVQIGTAGNLVCRLADDTADVTLNNLQQGIHPLAVAIVRHTGTTAAGVLLF